MQCIFVKLMAVFQIHSVDKWLKTYIVSVMPLVLLNENSRPEFRFTGCSLLSWGKKTRNNKVSLKGQASLSTSDECDRLRHLPISRRINVPNRKGKQGRLTWKVAVKTEL